MTKLTFLKSICTLIAFPFIGRSKSTDKYLPTTEIGQLEQDYCKASNALTDYRDRHGFTPGVRVRCQYQKDAPKLGRIAPYGNDWAGRGGLDIPIRFDNGRLQPWSVSNLTIIPDETV